MCLKYKVGEACTQQREIIDTLKILTWKHEDMKLFGGRS